MTPTDHVHGCCVVYLAHLLRQDCAAFTRNAFDEQFPFAYFAQLVTPGGILRHAPSPPMRRRLAPLWAEIFASSLMLDRWAHLRRAKYFTPSVAADDDPVALAAQLGLHDVVRALQARVLIAEARDAIHSSTL